MKGTAYKRLAVATGVAIAVLSLPAVTHSESVKAGSTPLRLSGAFLPKQLPRHERVPITAQISGTIAPESAARPALREFQIKLDRSITVNGDGFSSCSRSKLQSKDALQDCQRAITASGQARMAFGGSEPIRVPFAVINGGTRHGETVLYIRPNRQADVTDLGMGTVQLKSISEGRFGLEAVVKVPQVEGGSLVNFSLAFKRYRRGARQLGFVRARCRDGHLDAELGSYAFASDNPVEAHDPTVRTCVARD
jgi:hypothetical protein